MSLQHYTPQVTRTKVNISCHTRPGTEAWQRHMADLRRLEEAATRNGVYPLQLDLACLIAEHAAAELEIAR